WDSAQRALHHFLNSAAEDKKTAVKEAASRLQVALLKDGGTGQTLLSYDQEVDFGGNQIRLAAADSFAADVKTVGAEDHLHRIKAATEALAQGLGRRPGQNRSPARGRRVRDAVNNCVTDFNGVHDELDWAIAHTPAGEHRTTLENLRKPL